jgi:hypothetical protein
LLQTGYQDNIMVVFIFVSSDVIHQSLYKLLFTNMVPAVWVSITRWDGASVPIMPCTVLVYHEEWALNKLEYPIDSG